MIQKLKICLKNCKQKAKKERCDTFCRRWVKKGSKMNLVKSSRRTKILYGVRSLSLSSTSTTLAQQDKNCNSRNWFSEERSERYLKFFEHLETYSVFERTIFAFFAVFRKMSSTFPKGHFQPEIFFFKTFKIFDFLGFERKVSGWNSQNWFVWVQRMILLGNEFETKLLFLYMFWTLNESCFVFGLKNLRGIVKTEFYVSRETF